ncbi:MAG: hypothetical protein M3Q06_04995, partial [Bacteroidota bacterium]|nr:hypothetical protein [Bacteroidota bacterium]
MKSQIFLLLMMVLLFSCKKENDDNTTGGGTGQNKKLLKQEFSSGQYSGFIAYVYGADGKLAKLHQESSGGGSMTRQGFSITRNGSGMIERLVYLDDGSRGDSLTIVVSSSGDRYSKAVETITRFGSTTTITTDFTYDNAGRIVTSKEVVAFDGNAMDPL